MSDARMIVHACVDKTPSGSFRAAIGYAQEGTACLHCGAVIESKHELKLQDPEEESKS